MLQRFPEDLSMFAKLIKDTVMSEETEDAEKVRKLQETVLTTLSEMEDPNAIAETEAEIVNSQQLALLFEKYKLPFRIQ